MEFNWILIMNIIKLSLAVLLISFLGCATTPVPTQAAREVSKSRVYNLAFLEPKEGFGQVIVKRDEGLVPVCNTSVFANGVLLTDLAPGEKVTFYLPEGEQMVGARANGICGGGLVEAKASVSRSRPAVFRISYGSASEFSIQPTTF